MKVRRMTLNLRAINRLVQNDFFPNLWNRANPEQRQSFEFYVSRCDIESVRGWFQALRKLDLRDMSHRDLLELCKKYRIPNYSRMQKEDMVRILSEREANDNESPE